MEALRKEVKLVRALIEVLAREIGLSRKDWDDILVRAESQAGIHFIDEMTKTLPSSIEVNSQSSSALQNLQSLVDQANQRNESDATTYK